MNDRAKSSLFRRFLAVAVLAALVPVASGCDYISFYTRKQHWGKIFEGQPSMKVLKRLSPEDSLLLDGRIVQVPVRQEPLLLLAVSNQYKRNEIVAVRPLRFPSDAYSVLLPRGEYELFVFADLDKNGWFERDELIGRTPEESPVPVSPERSRDGSVVEGPPITVDSGQPRTTEFRVKVRVRTTNYVYASLDDEFFDPKFGSAGLYNPAAFMAHTQGFLYGLEDFDEEKTVVLFVHGISGTPREWKFIVDGLDRRRFQPFFFYYPSGLPLDKLGSVLAQVVDSLDKSAKNGRHRIVLAAHSLGGLVSLSAIQKLSAEGLPSSLKMFVSFSTPYGGDEAAHAWIDRMPAVVPVWRDVATRSEFLEKLVSRPCPETVSFYLFFSYNDPSTFKLGESSDGVVVLRSQLEPHVQAAATKVFGFNETHHGLLESETARKTFLELLDSAAPQGSGGPKEH
jgi:pimeloyl-ACP methyl ester carboxylesterase